LHPLTIPIAFLRNAIEPKSGPHIGGCHIFWENSRYRKFHKRDKAVFGVELDGEDLTKKLSTWSSYGMIKRLNDDF
jgi:hypothetical protein